MKDAELKQFKLDDEGKFFFQKDKTNPLPGVQVGTLSKGENALTPAVTALDAAQQSDVEVAVQRYIAGALETLVGLKDTEGLSAPVAGICERLYNALGILPREALQDLIDQLDTDMRAELRTKKVRLGPVLAFLPALNKPAGVRLRGLLWALAHDMALPASVPNDGVVSVAVEAGANKDFYQAIGYPLYGSRAVRIDMLDRVINAVYDSADKGQFKAQHKMAEWLGSSISDLYAVLEAMGHTKIHDPADEENVEAAEGAAQEEKPKEAEPAMPELATFRLKKGKASAGGAKAQKPKYKKPKPKKKEHKPREQRVMSATVEANPEDNPFAVLGQLKK